MSKFVYCKYNYMHIDPKSVTAIVENEIECNGKTEYWLTIIVDTHRIEKKYDDYRKMSSIIEKILENCE